MSFIKKQEEYISIVLSNLGYQDYVVLNPSSKPLLGDYQYNGAMALAKKYHEDPIVIANKIANQLKENKDMVNINVAEPGFINISFNNQALIDYANEIYQDIDINIDKLENKKILIDYGGANVAKALHIGHLRSANIGEALKRLARILGYDVISDAHLGDFGRPLGLVILEIKKRYPNLVYFKDNYSNEDEDLPITNQDLEEIYPIASLKAKEDETYLEEAREITYQLQQENNGYSAIWKKIVEISKKDIKSIYSLFNTDFDLWEGESNSISYIDEVVDLLKKEGIVYESEGALVIDVKEDSDDAPVPPFILIKSNGGILYSTTEIATLYKRIKTYDLDDIWYLTDSRQSLHFKQTFRVAKKLDVFKNVKLEHYGFGTMNDCDGKPFKTRDGRVLPLKDLFFQVEEATIKKIKDNILEEEKNKIATLTAIAAIKYADLLPYRTTDYIFDINKFSDVEGKTGPYLLYSTVRMKSLIRKAKELNYRMENITVIDESLDRNIILNILNMPVVLKNSLNAKSLNEIAEYLYKLTGSFNTFYAEKHVLTEQDERKRESWLVLANILLNINIKLLDILAIEVPDKI